MKQSNFGKTAAVTAAVAMLMTGVADAGQRGRMFGKDAPFLVGDLPSKSRLRQRLEKLPEHTRSRALKWLNEFSFPEDDLEQLRVDDEGAVFYSDMITPQPGSDVQAAAAAPEIALPTVDAFRLHSRPGAAKTVFLDFDGHVITGTAWNTSSGVTTYYAKGFDIDGIPADFNTEERNRIAEIWHRFAEDYAPFDIDVTTEQPAAFGPTVGRVLFTQDTDTNGAAMPSQGAGGVAYVNVFGKSNYVQYSPALVYYNRLGPNSPVFMAEAGAHEFGHNLGLAHDGVVDGTQNPNCPGDTGYFCGLGNGLVSWAPIMGVGYYSELTEWSKGEYPSANNTQDDMAIIAAKLAYRGDDVGYSMETSKPLVVESSGAIVSSNPQNDPGNVETVNKGVIETASDYDVFALDTGAGFASITVTPAWAAFGRSGLRGGNLDIELRVYSSTGSLLAATDPTDNTGATLAGTIPAGRYYVVVFGSANTVTPYSDYGSLGQYFISGSVPPVN